MTGLLGRLNKLEALDALDEDQTHGEQARILAWEEKLDRIYGAPDDPDPDRAIRVWGPAGRPKTWAELEQRMDDAWAEGEQA